MTTDGDLYLMPETRCMRWGHVFTAHELLGVACARCGKAQPGDWAEQHSEAIIASAQRSIDEWDAEIAIAQDEAAKPPWLAEQERADHLPLCDALDASYKPPDDNGYVWAPTEDSQR